MDTQTDELKSENSPRLKVKLTIILSLITAILIPALYFFVGLFDRSYSSSEVVEDRVVDIYDDGVWYQVVANTEEDIQRIYSEKNVIIEVDDGVIETTTKSLNLRTVFAEAGVVLGNHDKVEPHLLTPVHDGMRVKIVRVEKIKEDEERPIPKAIEYRDNPELLIGNENLIEEGEDGIRLVTIERQYEDGELVSEEIIGEKVTKEPVNQVVERGTKIVVIDFQQGVASYYTHPRYVGELVAAHNSYPFGSRVRVTNLVNGKSVIVTIVDRGIHSADRVIDLSTTSFSQIEEKWRGLAHVKLELLQQ